MGIRSSSPTTKSNQLPKVRTAAKPNASRNLKSLVAKQVSTMTNGRVINMPTRGKRKPAPSTAATMTRMGRQMGDVMR